MKNLSFYEKVFSMVKKIPKGKVTSYGRVASLLGHPRAARAVGYALSSLKKENETQIPWQRVINSKGKISFKGDTFRANLQRKLLEKEGIVFNHDGQIDFKRFGWP
ncbi:MAG: methylated-DNA--[protein]-cysteine S-methyltransferase [Leptospiraceae bacterium]|nr:methylated-DNA--[protein]-cysteine S-methyltransferase [Leptospiraceae bacterium]